MEAILEWKFWIAIAGAVLGSDAVFGFLPNAWIPYRSKLMKILNIIDTK